jgi:hypothetical protein
MGIARAQPILRATSACGLSVRLHSGRRRRVLASRLGVVVSDSAAAAAIALR